MTAATIRNASLYWDSSSPDEGWAWRTTSSDGREESGPVDGDLAADAELQDVIDAAGSDLPVECQDPARWTRFEHDGGGWEYRAE